MATGKNETAPYNQIQGIASINVPAYSNGDEDFFSVEEHYLHGVYMGIKWQCVEYARRWLFMRKQCIYHNVRHAADMFTNLKSIERVTDGKHFPLKTYPNCSPHEPQADSILIFSRTEDQPFGHVAIICEVVPGFVRIAEQNQDSTYWPGDYARELRLIQKNDLYYIEDDENVITGWMEIEDNHQLEPLDESNLDVILKQYQQQRPMGTLERCMIPNKTFELKDGWLDKNCPAEKYFIDINGEDVARVDADYLPYYKIDNYLLFHIGTASNEIHRMFMEATQRVMNDDELMARCGIPQVFWSRIRYSWAHDQHLEMSGRLDLAFNGEQLKVFEYNADSASALFECSIIQQKWAKAVQLQSTFLSGFQMHRTLVHNWKNMNIKSRVHLLIDNDPEEMLTALYMQQVMNEAGIVDTKLCTMTNDLYWKDGKIEDSNGRIVTMIWKLWMWDTIFNDYFNVQKERGLDVDNGTHWIPTNGEHPHICDIFLNDQIQVIEPLWKVITSNKALLPILWSMYPNHPHLLRSEWTLTDTLKCSGYVKKPIVGRCGQNVTLYNNDDESVIDETMGNYVNRNCIYQELFNLKCFDGYYCIFGSWILCGHFTGFCIREDQKLITDVESPITACCIVWK
ncbi:unnamed protein product [Rotaria sordida]|uniref:Peptidase C51 domain-containing protein n=1 Tax=Rotaria sordida TaxID=392033 RepID=A0A819A2V0_9BILA|nr:unnamed protein product [Rotaria sordida]